jgi:hypothetical protein
MDAVNNNNAPAKFVQGAILTDGEGVAIGSISFYAGKFNTYTEKSQSNLLSGDALAKLIASGAVKLVTRTERVETEKSGAFDQV